jgi:hypothetical protein
MDPKIESTHSPANRQAAARAWLFQQEADDLQAARVTPAQQLLFPANPRAVCEEMGLNWWAALKLHEDGFLSFAPELSPILDEAQEAEMRFVGSLVIAGCDRNMLSMLLAGLPKPFSYDLNRLYFDWGMRRWRLLPDPRTHPETHFTEWLESLVQTRDVGSLSGIGELAQDALSRVHGQVPLAAMYPAPSSITSDEEETRG